MLALLIQTELIHVGFECDGTNVNLAANGLWGYLEQSVPWVVSFWCLAH